LQTRGCIRGSRRQRNNRDVPYILNTHYGNAQGPGLAVL
jgi:hypothetical protein